MDISTIDVRLWGIRALVISFAMAACVSSTAFWLFIGAYAIGFTGFLAQRHIVYRPARRSYRSPTELGLSDVYELWLNTPDNQQLLTWQLKPQPGMPVILYLHGNNCNLSNRFERINRFARDGYGLLMLSFRGYGLSSGRPSEQNNVNDALLAYHFLRKSGYRPEDIIVYGESLGTGVAVQVAARRPDIAALILEAPYTSLKELVAYRIPSIPAYMFLKDEYNSVEHIKKVRAPMLIVHSTRDKVIPSFFGRELFGAAMGDKHFLRVIAAGHYGLFRAGHWPKIRQFIEQKVPGARKHAVQAREMAQMKRAWTKKRTERQVATAARIRHRFAH